MKVIEINYPTALEKCNNDNADVFIKLDNGENYCIVVATLEWISKYMKQTGKRYLQPCCPFLLVEKLDYDVIEAAINDYAKDNAYWLKVLSLSAGDKL